MKRITIFLPDELHERLRQEAVGSRLSLAEIIRMRLERSASGPKKTSRKTDPILNVAGICRGSQLGERIDEELYGD